MVETGRKPAQIVEEQAMKTTQGQGNPKLINEIVVRKLGG
jgi:Asp-tRNA(Asn)/Glu-tRNA(Gln) amidotransferase B subunit